MCGVNLLWNFGENEFISSGDIVCALSCHKFSSTAGVRYFGYKRDRDWVAVHSESKGTSCLTL